MTASAGEEGTAEGGEAEPAEAEAEEYVEEEMDEASMLKMLDALQDPQITCRSLFKRPGAGWEDTAGVLPAAAAEQLFEKGHAVLDGFLDGEEAAAGRKDALAAYAEGRLGAAHGASADTVYDKTARTDFTVFLPGPAAAAETFGAGLGRVLERLRALGAELDRAVKLADVERGTEYQLAVYDGSPASGSYYRVHRDAFPDDGSEAETNAGVPGQRRVSVVVYLQDPARPQDLDGAGGELELFLTKEQGGGVRRVAPEAGRAVVFLSGAVDHAVLPARFRRVAVTAWFH